MAGSISEETLKGIGIPEIQLRTCVLPMFESLGIKTVDDLHHFASDKSLQQLAEHVHQVPTAFVEVLVFNFKENPVQDAVVYIYSALQQKSKSLELEESSGRCMKYFCYGAGIFCFGIVLLLSSYSYSLSEAGMSEDRIAAEFAKTAASHVHTFAKCDEDSIHQQKYFRLGPSEEGYICMRDNYGRLNNKLQEMVNALWFAHEMNRTLILDWEIARVYDYIMWQNIFPHVTYRVAIPPTIRNKHLCTKEGHKVDSKSELFPYIHSKVGRSTLKQLLRRNNTQYLGIDAYHFFRMHAEHSFVRAFYANLWPAKLIMEKADKFIQTNFGNKPYMAVHLRDLEGSCVNRMKRAHWRAVTCSPEKSQTLEIMKSIGVFQDHNVSIFVASDFQKQKARHTYMDSTGYFYRGNCSVHLHECAMIDFEIVSRSNFFIGVFASSASRTMARVREFRRVRPGIFYPAVLHWDPTKNSKLKDYDSTWWEDSHTFLAKRE